MDDIVLWIIRIANQELGNRTLEHLWNVPVNSGISANKTNTKTQQKPQHSGRKIAELSLKIHKQNAAKHGITGAVQ